MGTKTKQRPGHDVAPLGLREMPHSQSHARALGSRCVEAGKSPSGAQDQERTKTGKWRIGNQRAGLRMTRSAERCAWPDQGPCPDMCSLSKPNLNGRTPG